MSSDVAQATANALPMWSGFCHLTEIKNTLKKKVVTSNAGWIKACGTLE